MVVKFTYYFPGFYRITCYVRWEVKQYFKLTPFGNVCLPKIIRIG